MSELVIMDANASNIEKFGMCGYKNTKNESYKPRRFWYFWHCK